MDRKINNVFHWTSIQEVAIIAFDDVYEQARFIVEDR